MDSPPGRAETKAEEISNLRKFVAKAQIRSALESSDPSLEFDAGAFYLFNFHLSPLSVDFSFT